LVSQKRKSAEVDVQDIRKVYSLFVDIKRSVQFLKDFEKEFMFHEVTEADEKMDTN
jgi:RuvB-like protein 2